MSKYIYAFGTFWCTKLYYKSLFLSLCFPVGKAFASSLKIIHMKIPIILYSCAIIDDDCMSIAILKQYIKRTGKLTLQCSFTNPREGITALKSGSKKIDFLFLDIEMEISGYDVAQILRSHSRFIIFTSSNRTYVINALSNANILLIKPFTFMELDQAVAQLIA